MQKINIKNLLRMQKSGYTIRPLHIILGNRSLEKFGEIVNIPGNTINFHPQFNAADELSFSVYKTQNEVQEQFWDKIVDFKTVYVKEYDEWFEIKVDIDDSEVITKKNITATSLCEAELGQIILHNIEINTEDDIAREEYTKPTLFYCKEDPQNSLLNRVLEKASHYSIAHVDETIMNIQRSFSIDGTSIYDFLTSTLVQEIGCIFLFDTNTRQIYVYDMETACLSCGYRSEDSFTICPECGGNIIHEAYGKDTSIFIDKNNLGDDIALTSETDQIKNCFRVIGGDDLINATIANVNPSGTNYIYYFNEDMLNDMPADLIEKIKQYNVLVEKYSNTTEFQLDKTLVDNYNEIINYVKRLYTDKYSSAKTTYVGYSNIPALYYDTIDFSSYLQNSMMPTYEQSEKTAKNQLALLTTSNLSPVSVTDVSKISVYTANNAVLAMAKAIIDTSLYKIKIIDSSLNSQTWKGKFSITSYTDDEDKAENDSFITVQINDDYVSYVNQRIDKAMAKYEDLGLTDLYKIELLDDFKEVLHKYCVERLTSYESAYQSAIDILIEQKTATESSSLYKTLYVPYYERLQALQAELTIRNKQVDTVNEFQRYLSNLIDKVHNEMNFENYIGTDLWKIFISYIREDDYSNDNYISDGLSNAELIDKANEILIVARKELIKSGEKQFTISGTLQNLLLLVDKNGDRFFEPILDDFTLGNFIRCKIDNAIYIMRLSDVTIDYSDLTKLNVTFTDAYRKNTPTINTVREILNNIQSMSTTYSTVKKQASQGEKANTTFAKLQKEGLDSALYNLHNSNSTAVFDEHGILVRGYDDEKDNYKDEQLRLNNNEVVFTTDNWRTVTTAIGRQKYTLNGIEYDEYGVNSQFCISPKIISGDIYSANFTTNSSGKVINGTHFNLTTGDCIIGGGKILYDSENNKLSVNADIIDLTGKVTFDSFNISLQENWQDIKDISSDASEKAIEALNSVEKSIETVDLEYYKSSSSVNLKNGEWTSEAPVWTQGSYIWSRQKTICQDGTVCYSDAVCITGNNGNDGYTPVKGVDYFDGNNGKDGNSSYIWIRYATDSSGTDMSSIPSSLSTYIGTAVTTSASAPISPSEYTWSKYVGKNGIPGTDGVDGKTTYLHIAYANSADGKIGFDTVNGTNKEFIGQYTDTILEDSTDCTKYTWSLIKGEDGIGITKLEEEYYLSTSDTEIINGSWNEQCPSWSKNKYIWTRTHIYWDNNSDTTTEPILAKALNNANENAVSAKQTAQSIIDNIYITNKTTINGGRIETGTITADAIATDAIVSKNYVEDETGSFLNLADGSFSSKYLKWDNMGTITATSGNIAGWKIDNTNGIYSEYLDSSTNIIYTTKISADTPYNFGVYAGDEPNFYVSRNGFLYAKDCNLSGSINTKSGSIANFTIDEDGLCTTSLKSFCSFFINNLSDFDYETAVNNRYLMQYFAFNTCLFYVDTIGSLGAKEITTNKVTINGVSSANESLTVSGNVKIKGGLEISNAAYFTDPSKIEISHYGQTKHPAMYTRNPISFDWDGSWLRIYVDNTIVASWSWGDARWE